MVQGNDECWALNVKRSLTVQSPRPFQFGAGFASRRPRCSIKHLNARKSDLGRICSLIAV